jgi:hypothetical protein
MNQAQGPQEHLPKSLIVSLPIAEHELINKVEKLWFCLE